MSVTFIEELPGKTSGGSRHYWDEVADALIKNEGKWAEVQTKPKGTKSPSSSVKSALRSRETEKVAFEITQRLVGSDITIYARAIALEPQDPDPEPDPEPEKPKRKRSRPKLVNGDPS